MKEAEQRGIEIGEQRGVEMIVKKLIAQGFSTDDIVGLTGLSPEQVEHLK